MDLSDNRVKLEQLKNLKYLYEVNLQFNSITQIPQLQPSDFANLEILNLAYNNLTVDSVRSLYACSKLKKLDLSSNHLEMLPADIKQLGCLEVLNLSGNMIDSLSCAVNPTLIFKALGSILRLKHLNLSRNKLSRIHCEQLTPNQDFN